MSIVQFNKVTRQNSHPACRTAERLRQPVEETQAAISLGMASLETPGNCSLEKRLDHASRARCHSKDKDRNGFHVRKGGTIGSKTAWEI